MQVSLRTPFVLTQAFARHAPPSGGCVINLLDHRIWLTQTLAMALAPNVRVNAVGPGPTLPSAPERRAVHPEWSAVPLARPASPDR